MQYKPLIIIVLFFPLFSFGENSYYENKFFIPSNPEDTIKIDTSDIKSFNDLNNWELVSYNSDTITADTVDLIPYIDSAKVKAKKAISFLDNEVLKDSLIKTSDTVRFHLKKLINYVKSLPIDTTKNYLKDLSQKELFIEFPSDSLIRKKQDSAYNYLRYIIDFIKKEPVKFKIYNRKKDSIAFPLTKEKKDSLRFIIYDEKNYPAGIWVHPKNNSITISFYEGTQIVETKQQEKILEELPTIKKIEKLKKPKQETFIFPQWDIGGIGNAYFNQGYLSNWAQGGESSLSSLLEVKFNVDYKKGKTIWDNDLNYKYGLLKAGEKELRKNEDKLEINSKFGSNANKDWYYSTLVNFKTQFFKGYDYPNDSVPVSSFLAPGYLVFSVGMDYKPSNNLTVLLSPISSKFTIMRNSKKFDPTKYGLKDGQNVKKELGAYVKSVFKHKLNKDISLENKINLFTNYLYKPQNVDVDWELTVNMKITDLITTTISTHIIYDDDIEFPVYKMVDGKEKVVNEVPKIQFKELLSVGVSYRF